MAPLRAALIATAAGLANAEILVQSVWSRSDANASASCQGPPAYNVVYGVNECVSVRGENGLTQRALQPFNATHMAVVEYYPESNCDAATTAFVLEMIQANAQCALQDFGMPDSGLPEEPMTDTTEVAPTTTPAPTTGTTLATDTPTSGTVVPSDSLPPSRRRQATGVPSDTNVTLAITPTSTATTSEAVTGTSVPRPPVFDIPASYMATITNGTLAKETERSLLINTFTTVGTVAKKDWCGDTNAPGIIKATYNVPIGSCFTVPAQTPQDKPHYGMAFAGQVGTANSVFVRWYDDSACNVAQTLYFDAVGLSQCMAVDETSPTTASFAIKNAAAPVTTTSTKAATTTTMVAAPTPSNFQSAASTSAAASLGALAAALLSAVAMMF